MLTLALIATLLAIVYCYLKRCHTLFKRLGIPGPEPVLLFGNVGDFKAKAYEGCSTKIAWKRVLRDPFPSDLRATTVFPLDVLSGWTQKYGKVYGFYEGLHPSIVVSDPDLTQQILVKKFSYFSERPPCSPFLNDTEHISIQNATGELWKRQRTVVAKAFHTKCLREIIPVVTSVSQRLLHRLEKMDEKLEEGFDITDLVDRYTLDAFANAAFDYNSDSLNNDNELLLKYMTAFNYSSCAENPLAGFARLFPVLTPLLQIFDKTHRQLHALHLKQMRNLIQKEKQKIEHCPDNESANLLRRLIEGYTVSLDDDNNEEKRYLSDEEVLAQAASLVGGGLGPTHSVMAFALHLLATNPRVQTKLRDQILAVCPIHEPLNTESLSRLDYMDNVLDETMRIFPVIPGVARRCTEDCEIDGVRFTKGMKVRVMATSLYSDEKYYPQPEKFIPERFSKDRRKDKPYYSYLPFGHGPRMCVGLKFGITQIKIALVQILRHYVIDTSSQTESPLQTTLRPFLCPKNGVHVRLLKREP